MVHVVQLFRLKDKNSKNGSGVITINDKNEFVFIFIFPKDVFLIKKILDSDGIIVLYNISTNSEIKLVSSTFKDYFEEI